MYGAIVALTVLNEELDNSETGVDVTPSLSASQTPVQILVGNEIMDVASGTSTLTVTRGTEGTTAATHSSSADIFEVLRVVPRADSLLVYYVGNDGYVNAKRIVIADDATQSLPLATGATEGQLLRINNQEAYALATPDIDIFDEAAAHATLSALDTDGVYIKEITFTETAGAGTYTSTVAVLAGQRLLDAEWQTTATFDADTAALSLGRNTALTDFFNAANVKTAAASGALSIGLSGGKEGYKFAGNDTITAALVCAGTGGTTGRARLLLVLSRPSTATAATKA